MTRLATIELFKEYMNFSIGHFTVFSATERENLHGHNYHLYVSLLTEIDHEGLSFNYRLYKDKFKKLCNTIDESVALAGLCKYLTFAENDKYHIVTFNQEDMYFLKRDAIILPLYNVTVEELSSWFINQIKQDKAELAQNRIRGMTVKIFSGAGQSGATSWEIK